MHRIPSSARRVTQPLIALIAALSLIVSTASAGAFSGIGPGPGDPRVSTTGGFAKYLVLIILDGARPDYLTVTHLPHLDAMRAQGTQYTNAISGILESETPAAHTTISTGTTPRRNGILGFDWAENDARFSIFNPDIVRAGAMERIMQSSGVPTITGLFKARYPKAKAVAISGAKYYAADPLGGPAADAIMYFRNDSTNHYAPTSIPGHVPPPGVLEDPAVNVPETLPSKSYGTGDALVTKLVLDSFAAMHQRVTLINYPDFDWPLGHVDGGPINRPKVIALMQLFDHGLGQIEDAYRQAGILNKTLFVITADHGMAPLHRWVSQDLFTKAVTDAGTTSPAQAYSTGAYIWLKDQDKALAVSKNILKNRDPGIESVYYWSTASKIPQYIAAPGQTITTAVDGANRFLLYTLANAHHPAVVTFMKRNATAAKPTTGWKADHGGSSWLAQHVPLVVYGPNIRQGAVISSPAQLIDIGPTVLADLGVAAPGMDGHVLTDAFTIPAAADTPARTDEITRVWPVVTALQAQDKLERGKK